MFPHQKRALEECRGRNRVAFYHDMGCGKTFTGAEKMMLLGAEYNLVICQKSKVNDWVEHFRQYYPDVNVIDFTKPKAALGPGVVVVNYELAWRRPELENLPNITLMLDESSMIQNEAAKRSRFVLNRLNYENVILLSGTPTSGRYERLWSQCRLLGWNISKKEFYARYVIEKEIQIQSARFPIKIVIGYRNVSELKFYLRRYGAQFLKSEEILDLPAQNFITQEVDATPQYRTFRRSRVVDLDDRTLVGDNSLTALLYERMLCGQYCKPKLEAFADLLDSTDDRLLVFYNFTEELEALKKIAKGRPISIVNGPTKDLTAYENEDNSVTFCQYQAAAMGLNLQKANKIIYYTLPLSSELFEQSKKRTHRIGQSRACYYYTLICRGSVEVKILETLRQRRDYTNDLFSQGFENQGFREKSKKS